MCVCAVLGYDAGTGGELIVVAQRVAGLHRPGSCLSSGSMLWGVTSGHAGFGIFALGQQVMAAEGSQNRICAGWCCSSHLHLCGRWRNPTGVMTHFPKQLGTLC